MALRYRRGKLFCAATSTPMDNDIYIDDEMHYDLAVIAQVIYPDENESNNGVWHIKNKRVFDYILGPKEQADES